MSKHYICEELGCVYRLNDGILEYVPTYNGSMFDSDEFGAVEELMVGEERVTFKGIDTNLSAVFKYVTEKLS